jgi:hypothetical protein
MYQLASSDKKRFLWKGGQTLTEKINWTLNIQVIQGPEDMDV